MHNKLRYKCTAVLALALTGAAASPASADQYKQVADNGRVECAVSKQELTRIALIGDQFASVSKLSSGTPYNDFAVTNEPLRGDIYISVPETFAPASISFFATTKKGYTYKFACKAEAIEAQQVFLTNPALAQNEARDWEKTPSADSGPIRLVQAMASNAILEGFEIRQSAAAPTRVGDLEVQLIAEYRGAALLGKSIKLTNRGRKMLSINERDIAPKDALAVSIAAPSLAPNTSTTAFVVGTNPEGQP